MAARARRVFCLGEPARFGLCLLDSLHTKLRHLSNPGWYVSFSVKIESSPSEARYQPPPNHIDVHFEENILGEVHLELPRKDSAILLPLGHAGVICPFFRLRHEEWARPDKFVSLAAALILEWNGHVLLTRRTEAGFC